MRALYDVANLGKAAHPRRGHGWRPRSIRAERDQGMWFADDVPPGTYRVIARTDGVWRELRSSVTGGVDQIVMQGPENADALELLIDRRGDMAVWSREYRGD